MDKQRMPSGTEELWALLQQSEGWQRAIHESREASSRGASPDEIVEVCLDALDTTPEELSTNIPDQVLVGMEQEDREKLPQAIGWLLTAVVLQMANGKAPELPVATTHAAWVTRQNGLPFVWGMATPLDPDRAIADFIEKCYQTFPPESFAYSENGARDAEWLARNLNGETYRQIALSDSRAGLAPEARVSPEEYPNEVRTASERVRKAAARAKAKWTKLASSMSAEEAPRD